MFKDLSTVARAVYEYIWKIKALCLGLIDVCYIMAYLGGAMVNLSNFIRNLEISTENPCDVYRILLLIRSYMNPNNRYNI